MNARTELESGLESAFESIERMSGLRATMHDCSGFFCDAKLRPLLRAGRLFHDLPFCQQRREGCVACDWIAGNAAAAKADGPFFHRCWRGPWQLLIPFKWKDRHLGSLFLGPFRVPGEACDGAASLPLRRKEELRKDFALYAALADGLALKSVAALERGAKGERWEAVYRFVANRGVKGAGIKELAKELKLSPSRASHLAKELFGKPLEALVMEHRVNRARALLEGSSMSLSEMAESLGFCDLHYLSRVFKRMTGTPPGKYRAQARKRLRNGP